jgi:hypothetical protein
MNKRVALLCISFIALVPACKKNEEKMKSEKKHKEQKPKKEMEKKNQESAMTEDDIDVKSDLLKK